MDIYIVYICIYIYYIQNNYNLLGEQGIIGINYIGDMCIIYIYMPQNCYNIYICIIGILVGIYIYKL